MSTHSEQILADLIPSLVNKYTFPFVEALFSYPETSPVPENAIQVTQKIIKFTQYLFAATKGKGLEPPPEIAMAMAARQLSTTFGQDWTPGVF